jgi:hypothetical protein
MASVQLSGPRVVAAAKPAALGGLLLTPSLAVPKGRRARGLVVRAATVVSPKVTNRTLRCRLSCWGSVVADLQGASGSLCSVLWVLGRGTLVVEISKFYVNGMNVALKKKILLSWLRRSLGRLKILCGARFTSCHSLRQEKPSDWKRKNPHLNLSSILVTLY